MTPEELYLLKHPDTSAYAYDGARVNPYAYCGGSVVDNFNDWDVADFTGDNLDIMNDYLSKQTSLPFDPEGFTEGYDSRVPYDSIFGLGKNRQAKKAEKKLAKSEKLLAKGNTKGAARKMVKAQNILQKISKGQQAVAGAQQQQQDVRDAQDQLAINTAALSDRPIDQVQPLSSTPMSQVASNSGGGGIPLSDTAGNIGADSAAPSTATNPDEPTGWLANEKELSNVTVVGHKGTNKNLPFILIGAVLLVVALIYFAPKFLKK